MFAREGCTGSFSVSLGKTTEEKVAYCKARFRRILNGCHTNTITAKKGGVLREKCAEYFLTARPEGERPFKDHWANWGDLKCKETDTSNIGGEESLLHGTCTCWYANYPSHLDTFKMPKSNKCSDVHRNDLL
jgi:hypothetical protein